MFEFRSEASPEGEFYETVIAAGGQLEQTTRQTQQKSPPDLRQAVGLSPLGYKLQNERGKPRILIRDEPIASYIEEALKGYASGRFQTQSEVRRFLKTVLISKNQKSWQRNIPTL